MRKVLDEVIGSIVKLIAILIGIWVVVLFMAYLFSKLWVWVLLVVAIFIGVRIYWAYQRRW